MEGGDRLTRLRVKRKESGMMQAELAQQARLSAPFVCDLEAGRRGAKTDTWERIADVLGCSVDEIMEPKEEDSGSE